MAFNKGGNQAQQPKISTQFGTFFSTEAGNGEYSFVKISSYDDKVAFNFYKGQSGSGNKSNSQFVQFDYETICGILTYVIEPLIVQRNLKFQNGEEYPVGTWLNYALTFVDKETKQLRTVGNFIIKSEISPVTNRNTVYVCYSNGTDEWKVAFGTSGLQTQMTLEHPNSNTGLDIGDSRFQMFAYILRSIVNSWIPIMLINHQTGIMMNNFNAIKGKLGIESNFKKREGGNKNYEGNNYRSAQPDFDSGDSGAAGGEAPSEGLPW